MLWPTVGYLCACDSRMSQTMTTSNNFFQLLEVTFEVIFLLPYLIIFFYLLFIFCHYLKSKSNGRWDIRLTQKRKGKLFLFIFANNVTYIWSKKLFIICQFSRIKNPWLKQNIWTTKRGTSVMVSNVSRSSPRQV